MQSNLKAEIIKFSSCKIIKDPIRESIFKMIKKDEPYNEKEELAKVNDKWEYVDRTFDTESKILNVKRKKKEENNESTVKANFEIKDENTLTIVEIKEAGSDPFFNEETKEIDFKNTQVKYFVYFYKLAEGIVEKYNYVGRHKELLFIKNAKVTILFQAQRIHKI